jgi:hypothetical protein
LQLFVIFEVLYPSEFSPEALQRTALMVTKPKACETILTDNHRQAYHHGIRDAKFVIAGKTVTAEDKASDDRLQQIVGKTHATEDAQVMEHSTHTSKSIPC